MVHSTDTIQARSSTIDNNCTIKENAAVYLPSAILWLLLLLYSWTQFFSSMLAVISKSQFQFPRLLVTSLGRVALLVSLSFVSCSWLYQGSSHNPVQGVWVTGTVLELQAKLSEDIPGTGLTFFSEHLAKPFCLLREMCYSRLIQWKGKGRTTMCQIMSASPEKLQKILLSIRKHYRPN